MNGSQIKALMPNLTAKELAAEFERAPKAKAAYDGVAASLTALQTAAAALTTALAANGATIAGCATQIAAVNALLPSAG